MLDIRTSAIRHRTAKLRIWTSKVTEVRPC